MNVETLKTRRQASEEQFNKIQELREQATTQIAKYDTELDRLRGEYRAYTVLIEEYDSNVPQDPASTVVIEGDVIKPVKREKKRGQKQ